MPANNKDDKSAKRSARKCSTLESTDDQSLTSIVDNGPSASSLAYKRRPKGHCIKEETPQSTGFAVDQQPSPERSKNKSPVELRQWPESHDYDRTTKSEPFLAEATRSNISVSLFADKSDGRHSNVLGLLEDTYEEDAPKGSFASSLSHLPLQFTAACKLSEDPAIPRDNFARPSLSDPPLYSMPPSRQPALSCVKPLELKDHFSDLQSAVHREQKLDAGEEWRAAAAKSQYGTFEPSSASRLLSRNFSMTEAWKQNTNAKIPQPTGAPLNNVDFSFARWSRLPVVSIAGAEARGALYRERQPCDLHKLALSFAQLDFPCAARLPPPTFLFKSPMETRLTRTRLARDGCTLDISELANSKEKSFILGSIESVGEVLRPDSESAFLFSFTPFTKLELRDNEVTKELVFGKLERARAGLDSPPKRARANTKQHPLMDNVQHVSKLHGKHNLNMLNASGANLAQTAPFKACDEGKKPTATALCTHLHTAVLPIVSKDGHDGVDDQARDHEPTEDRTRFDALVRRLQQKVSEKSELDSRRGSTRTSKSLRAPSDSGSHVRLDSSYRSNASKSSSGSSLNLCKGVQATTRTKMTEQLLQHSSKMNYGTISDSGSSAIIRADKIGKDGSISSSLATNLTQMTESSRTSGPFSVTAAVSSASASPQDHAPASTIPEPSRTIISAQPNVLSSFSHNTQAPSFVPDKGYWTGNTVPSQALYNPLVTHLTSASHLPFSTGPTMLPQPGALQGLLPSIESLFPQLPSHFTLPTLAPQAPNPHVRPPAPLPAGQHWPVFKRGRQPRRSPYVALNAAEQQKIEEHIEFLKSIIPNFAAVSKRRQQIRWKREQDKMRRQVAKMYPQQALWCESHLADWSHHQRPFPSIHSHYSAVPVYQGPQYLRPDYPIPAPHFSQPQSYSVQPIPAAPGIYTWLTNSNMAV